MVEDFSLDQRNRELPLKNIRKSNRRFWLDCASDPSMVVSGKQIL